jgi:PhnB protein
MTTASEAKAAAVNPIPAGYHTITPYLVALDAPGLIEFVKQTFGAEETFRTIGGAGGIHAEVRVGESMLMVGGGGPGLAWRGEPRLAALHVYVKDADAVYRRALEAGGVSIDAPADQEYGERSGSVKDPFGNYWYIATAKGEHYIPKGLHSVNIYLHAVGAPQVIDFLRLGLGGEELARYASPDGVVHHAAVRIGDSVVELGEAHGPYQPMVSMVYMYVPDVDALYQRALAAGASSISPPADQSYGDRTAGVKDAFGNHWYIATHVKDVAS